MSLDFTHMLTKEVLDSWIRDILTPQEKIGIQFAASVVSKASLIPDENKKKFMA
jgi:hypothetical protein